MPGTWEWSLTSLLVSISCLHWPIISYIHGDGLFFFGFLLTKIASLWGVSYFNLLFWCFPPWKKDISYKWIITLRCQYLRVFGLQWNWCIVIIYHITNNSIKRIHIIFTALLSPRSTNVSCAFKWQQSTIKGWITNLFFMSLKIKFKWIIEWGFSYPCFWYRF